MLTRKSSSIASVLLIASVTVGSEAHAFEPISTVASILGGSIFCKMIQCKSIEKNIFIIKDRELEKKQLDHLAQMKRDFEWAKEDNCRYSPALNMNEMFCYNTSGKYYIKRVENE